MLNSLISNVPADLQFTLYREVRERLRRLCADNEHARFVGIGTSEERREIGAVVVGDGPRTASLIAGNHADEPVGPETLYLLAKWLIGLRDHNGLLNQWTFLIIPHTNPDGQARNWRWIARWPRFNAYLSDRVREVPGRDIEFGYPSMRLENEVVSTFLSRRGPVDLHMSMHGMGLSEGAMLLIERRWSYRTDGLQRDFREFARDAGLRMHDHNRKGEKGFFYIGPGFWTTPEGDAMRAYFRTQGDEGMASRFHDSSMEYVRSLGGDPLCLVTELPLFLIEAQPGPPGQPVAYLGVKEKLADWTARAQRGDDLEREQEEHRIRPLELSTAVRLQLRALSVGIDTVTSKVK